MKVIVTLFTTSALLLTACTKIETETANSTNNSNTQLRAISSGNPVYVFFTGHSSTRNCMFGRGDCLLAITSQISGTQKNGAWPIAVSLNGSQLKIANTTTLKSDDDILNIPSVGLTVPEAICKQLNAYFIQILPGSYTVKYDENPLGNLSYVYESKHLAGVSCPY